MPGSEIGIRRNAVPGQWNYPNNDDNYYSSSLGYVDLSSIYGLLQQPGHQADIWYIGVYTPNQALGSFVLNGSLLTGQPMSFNGSGSSVAAGNQPPGQWGFFQITVPSDPNLLGWDVRLVGVTQGNPQMVVCADTLPTSLSTSGGWVPNYWNPNASTNWPSGVQWLAGVDWTTCGGGPMLEMGMGNPLQPGTYYIGVQDPNNTNSYTLQSRGIGTGYTIPVRSLNFTGAATNLALPVGQADYYQVVVPSNVPDWKLHLSAVAGDVLLKVEANFLPNSGSAEVEEYNWPYGYAQSGQGGQLMEKPGDEQWALLPYYANNDSYYATNLLPGTYYVLVAGQGQNLVNNCEGTGNSSYTLTSGIEPVTQLPTTLSYGNDLLFTNAQLGGETKFYQFTVPAGIASIEVTLGNIVGNPQMTLNYGTNLVTPNYYGDAYGNYGGTNVVWNSGNLITIPNPQAGVYSLSVYGAIVNSGNYPNASYVLQVHAAPPPVVAFDGGTFAVTNQAPGVWQYFQITVPSDLNLLGWDIRLVGVTEGNPQMVVCADTLPTSLGMSPWWWDANASTNWPSGVQWLAGVDWTTCGGGPMLEMGMGNPLQPGTYYIGVQDPNNTNSYTLQSRGIGTGYTIPVRSLNFTGAATNLALPVGQADYYQVVVPSNVPDWKLHLSAVAGDVLLKVEANFLPNSGSAEVEEYNWPYGYAQSGQGGQLMEKPGDEQWALLPYYANNDSYYATNLLPGTYYVLVAGQGQNLVNNCEGTGNSSYTLTSGIEPVTQLPTTLSYGNDLLFTNAQLGGETKFYQFTVPAGIASIEVTLGNIVGNPQMTLNYGTNLVTPNYYGDAYGNYGGTNVVWNSGNLITIPNPQAGVYSLSVYGAIVNSGPPYYTNSYADASYVLEVNAPVVPQLSISPDFDSGNLTNLVSGVLADTEHSYYQVIVPASVVGAPVLGWELQLATLTGSPSVRVRQNLLPDNTCDTTAFASPNAIIVPPYLVPGTWYVDVVGGGSTAYTLTSSVITTNTLAHPVWMMPSVGQTNTAQGLALPLIGDSGVDTNGNPLPGDQGIDLKQGSYDYYAVMVPTNNAGLLRTELQAISGNPVLYLRVLYAPTLSHYSGGQYDINECGNPYGRTPLYDRSLVGGTTEYGNWVPLNGRSQSQLSPGLWVLAVQAAGDANVRYRLQISCGNPATNALLQNLTLEGGSFTNQNLDGGDWRYYRVQIPDPAPTNWTVTFSRTLGNAMMFVRDTIPPGDGNTSANYTGSTPINWSTDAKNEGPYPSFNMPGTYNLTTPPLRPGDVYYLGFWSPIDTTFSVSSATNGGVINVTNILAFFGGSIVSNIPGHGTLQYHMDVPSNATRILFQATNSTNLVFTLD